MKYGDALESANLRGVPFAERYQIDERTQCWRWIGSVSTDGYGLWSAYGQKTAHRASYVMNRGQIPTGLHVLHKCDEPSCVNPSHLFLGTHQDNMADLRAKGRAYGARGELNSGAKISEAEAMQIIRDARPATTIAVQYGITRETVDLIRNGRTWKHLFSEQLKAKRLAQSRKTLNDLERMAILVDLRTQAVIAAQYGISQSLVSSIKRKK